MELKTDVHINLDLHFTDDDLANGAELARLAAVCDGLYLLMKAGGHEAPAPEGLPLRTLPAIEAIETQPEPTPADKDEPDAEPTALDDKQPAGQRRTMPASRNWSFEKFDSHVRAELKRLGCNGELPTGTVWDHERSPDLPTLTGVLRRYRCKNMAEFKEKLAFQPSTAQNGNTNGHAGRHL